MTSDTEKLNAILRTDFHAFARKAFETINPGTIYRDNWHIRLLTWQLSRCVSGEIKRLIINLPPRSGKSFIFSVAFPAWCLGQDPTDRLLCISHTDSLATALSRDCRRVMESPWYQRAFPNTRFDNQKNTELEYFTTENGFRYATSIGGALTGRGGDFIIVDDPIKTGDAASEAERNRVNEHYSNTLYTRLDNKNEGVIIIVMQRAHVDDLVGYVLDKDDWTLVSLPAIAEQTETLQIGEDEFYTREEGEALHPKRENLITLARIKDNVGSFVFAAQYQQSPVPAAGNLIKREWFRFYEDRPDRMRFDQTIQSWDTAISEGDGASYSVCTTWGIIEHRYYLLDVLRGRFNFPTLRRLVKSRSRTWGANRVLIERASSGYQLLEVLLQETRVPVIAVPVDTDKEARVARISASIEAGRVYLPEHEPWIATFLDEVLAFPNGKYDDQVDSLTQFLYWAHRQDRRVPEVRVRGFGGSSGGVVDRYSERTGISILQAHLRGSF